MNTLLDIYIQIKSKIPFFCSAHLLEDNHFLVQSFLMIKLITFLWDIQNTKVNTVYCIRFSLIHSV